MNSSDESTMIIESKLHPLTCLASLNGREKKALLDQGIVMCKTLIETPDLLSKIGMQDAEIKKVIEEIDSL